MTILYLTSTTITFLLLAITWTSKNLYNLLIKIVFSVLAIEGFGLLLLASGLAIEPTVTLFVHRFVPMHFYNIFSGATILFFGLTWSRTYTFNVLIKIILILVGLVSIANLIIIH